MKIEVNNIYQRRTISKFKVGMVVVIFILIFGVILWRLYYERAQTTGVDSFAEFMGVNTFLDEKENSEILGEIENQISNNETVENNTNNPDIYVPNFTEQSRYNVEKIYNLADDGQKRVYLTFDDGPSKDVTPIVLDILKEENIHATFFVLGNKVEASPEILKRAYDEGHYIGNHGYSHVYSQIYASTDTVFEEYNQCEESIRQALGIPEYSTHLFRFPGGSVGGPYDSIKSSCLNHFAEANVGVLDWNCLTRDSEGSYTKEQLLENFKNTSYGKNNLVILMHDAGGKILVTDALREIIACLRDEGYIFGDMRELVAME